MGTWDLSTTTLGRRNAMLGEWTSSSYSERVCTRSRKTVLIASCHELKVAQRAVVGVEHERREALGVSDTT
jgi:hypothetical protein